MNAMKVCLYWLDTNWVKKGVAENVVVIVDFEKSAFTIYTTYTVPSGVNAIEVKRKTDLTSYAKVLENAGFKKIEK